MPALGDQPAHAEVAIHYGKFINAAIKFIIVAWVLFFVIKGMNSMKRKEEATPAARSPEIPPD